MTIYSERLSRLTHSLQNHGVECICITPGADLIYFTGYNALPLERLTCLAVRSNGDAFLIVPHLELMAAQVHQPEDHGIQLVSWQETENAYELLHKLIGQANVVAVSDLMWARHVFGIQKSFGLNVSLAESIISDLRAVKTQEEIQAISEAGQAIDEVHRNISQWLRPGRSEREVGRDIADAIIASGHRTVDFVIVGSGPNGASPHHDLSDRIIQRGEPIVVDIGGTMPSGYCSDSTRMYSIGDVEHEFMTYYSVLQSAQSRAVLEAKVGMSGAEVDALARDVLADGGLGQYFVHRTGHGLGLETHEEPYIVASNSKPLVPGNVFSIEPGFYVPGRFGARIEDIVYLTDEGAVSVNHSPRDFVVLD